MSNKVKGGASIVLMSILFYMMITTKYTHALGDYILEFVGLRSWTGDYRGFHLAIIYFGIPFIISLFVVEKYAIDRLNMRRKSVFLIFIVLMTVFNFTTGAIVINIKKNSPDLLAIGLNSQNSFMDYKTKNNEFIEFKAEFELTNYSNEKRAFYISMDSPIDDGIKDISFFTFDGKRAIFQLNGNETKLFSLNSNEYKVNSGKIIKDITSFGYVDEVILTDDEGHKVRLNSNNGFLAELSR